MPSLIAIFGFNKAVQSMQQYMLSVNVAAYCNFDCCQRTKEWTIDRARVCSLQLFVTKNADYLGVGATNIRPYMYHPAVAFLGKGSATLNFGDRPFVYQFDSAPELVSHSVSIC